VTNEWLLGVGDMLAWFFLFMGVHPRAWPLLRMCLLSSCMRRHRTMLRTMLSTRLDVWSNCHDRQKLQCRLRVWEPAARAGVGAAARHDVVVCRPHGSEWSSAMPRHVFLECTERPDGAPNCR